MFNLYYGNFDAVVNSYEEAEELLTAKFGFWNPDEVFLEEI